MSRKKLTRWAAGLLAAVLLLTLLGSAGLYAAKRRTCDRYGDVWTDLHLLLSQRDEGTSAAPLGHRLRCLWTYLSSNSMDPLLREWRLLVEESREQGALQISYLAWEGPSCRYQSGSGACTAQSTGTLELVRGSTERDGDGYVHETVWYLLDASLLCQDGGLLGYGSQLRVSRAVTDSDSAPSDQYQLTYSAAHCEAAHSGDTVWLEEPQLDYATEQWLAGAMDKDAEQ